MNQLTDDLTPTRNLTRALTRLFALAAWLGATAPARAEPTNMVQPHESCVPCHGADGISRDAYVPNLAGQNGPYLYNQLRAFREGRRSHKEMLYISRKLTDDDMRALAAYYSSLPPR
jgi:cytochrome c553